MRGARSGGGAWRSRVMALCIVGGAIAVVVMLYSPPATSAVVSPASRSQAGQKDDNSETELSPNKGGDDEESGLQPASLAGKDAAASSESEDPVPPAPAKHSDEKDPERRRKPSEDGSKKSKMGKGEEDDDQDDAKEELKERDAANVCLDARLKVFRDPRAEKFLALTVNATYIFYESLVSNLDPHFDPAVLPAPANADKPVMVGLATWPQSGTTWTKHMFEIATGVASEAIYRERGVKQFYGGWRVAEGQTGLARPIHGDEPAFIKTHNTKIEAGFNYYDRVVRLVRNPFDNVRANWNRKVKEGYMKESVEGFNRFAAEHIGAYMRWHCEWNNHARRGIPVLNINYHDILRYPKHEMRKMLTFIGYPINETALDRALELFPPIHHTADLLPLYWQEYTESGAAAAAASLIRGVNHCAINLIKRPLSPVYATAPTAKAPRVCELEGSEETCAREDDAALDPDDIESTENGGMGEAEDDDADEVVEEKGRPQEGTPEASSSPYAHERKDADSTEEDDRFTAPSRGESYTDGVIDERKEEREDEGQQTRTPLVKANEGVDEGVEDVNAGRYASPAVEDNADEEAEDKQDTGKTRRNWGESSDREATERPTKPTQRVTTKQPAKERIRHSDDKKFMFPSR